MRRLLLIAATIALLVGATTGVASARFASDGARPASTPAAAPFRAPLAAPRPDATQRGAYGYRAAARIGAAMQRGAAAPAPAAPASAAGATVTVTAVVLPVVLIVVDAHDGHVAKLITNTPERDATGVIYIVRTGSESGRAAALDGATWRAARAALAHARAGTGTVWSD
jgi:hypothetical protein